MKVDVQPVCGVLRVWLKADAKYGDPYDWACTTKHLSETEVELLGASKPITPAIWRAIRDDFRQRGIERVLMVRKTCGKTRDRWKSTAKRA